jgi:DNA-binding NarL/FixJ family response regulator
MHNDERYVTRALKAGAVGYLLKDSVEEDLIQAIEFANQGRRFFSPAVARLLESRQGPALLPDHIEDRYELLTERERQVYQLLAEGHSNKEIASRLGLSLHTVETHRTRVMEKLDVHSAAELVLSAVRRGLVR